MRRRARRDANETAIVNALKAIGVCVHRVNSDSLPDLLTHFRGVWTPVEVKVKGGTLTPGQVDTYQQSPFPIVSSVAEALALFGVH